MQYQLDKLPPLRPKSLVSISDQEFSDILSLNKKNCMFCTPSSEKKILVETEHFFVTFDDSPLLEGHLLIHTKAHLGCSAEIPKEQISEFLSLKESVRDLVTKVYGRCSFYEHGRAGHCAISSGEILCEHFHLHALPLAQNISSVIAAQHEQKEIKKFDELVFYYEQFDRYLYYENEKSTYLYIVTEEIPSHFLRTIIANSIGYPERADWNISANVKLINAFKKKVAISCPN